MRPPLGLGPLVRLLGTSSDRLRVTRLGRMTRMGDSDLDSDRPLGTSSGPGTSRAAGCVLGDRATTCVCSEIDESTNVVSLNARRVGGFPLK